MKDNIPKETANISTPGLYHITGKYFQKAQKDEEWHSKFFYGIRSVELR